MTATLARAELAQNIQPIYIFKIRIKRYYLIGFEHRLISLRSDDVRVKVKTVILRYITQRMYIGLSAFSYISPMLFVSFSFEPPSMLKD